ncbi:MAG TPA: hypothetical protein VMZ27_05200 [Candidatus Saccharimonadales bacterium]|nr:hypothetical protein [Candidatus Saccharimonadales bacterium]
MDAAPIDKSQDWIELKPGAHLFLDDYLIEQSSGLERKVNSPKRSLPGPVVTGKEDKNFQPYVTVLKDPSTSLFRMWYNVPVNGGQSHLAYITSQDGVHWIRPHQVLEDPAKIIFGASVLDEGIGFKDLERRFKMVWYNGGMMMAHSSDGLRWVADSPKPVLTGINDILHLARDSARDRYIAVFGFPSSPNDGYKGKTQNMSQKGYRRCVGQSTSSDGIHWTTPRRIIAPDAKDEGITEYYSVGGVVTRGHTLVGLLKVLRDDLPCEPGGKVDGLGYTVLAWSNDGESWQRDREPFLDRDHEKGSWDHAMAWMDCQLPVGDEVYMYYGGYARGHKVERFTERQLGMVRIKRDRYVAREALNDGVLRTCQILLPSGGVTLNVDASEGAARVQVLDAHRKPIRGFTFGDCATIKEDGLNVPIRWKRKFSELKRQPIYLEMSLHRAKLYALNVEDEAR